MKVKSFQFYHYDYSEDIENQINDFIQGKEVVDIKMSSAVERDDYSDNHDKYTQVLIMYREESQ